MMGRKGFFVLFGPPGMGKTTEALMTFQDSLYIASAESLDQFYQVWLESPEGKASGRKPPKKIVVIDQYSVNGSAVTIDKNGHMVKVPQRETLENAIEEVTKVLSHDKVEGRPPRFRNVIIDEASVFWDRVFLEIATEMSQGLNGVDKNKDGRAHYGALAIWTRQVIDRARTVVSMGANLIAVAHDVEPDGQKRGGPQMPSQKTMRIFGADSHGVLLRTIEGGGGLGLSGEVDTAKFAWKMFASKEWVSKIRGISNARFEEIKFWPLEQIIREAGFEP